MPNKIFARKAEIEIISKLEVYEKADLPVTNILIKYAANNFEVLVKNTFK